MNAPIIRLPHASHPCINSWRRQLLSARRCSPHSMLQSESNSPEARPSHHFDWRCASSWQWRAESGIPSKGAPYHAALVECS